MILPFSTQLNGKPTYFVEKILIGIDKYIGVYHTELFLKSFQEKFKSKPPANYSAKIHTIREDKKDRWKVGTEIHFFINCRQKDMFRFAPVLQVVSVQKITVLWYRQECNAFLEYKYTYKNRNARVYIDGAAIKKEAIEQLSKNDGFDTPEEFFEYFNENFTGKLIHWTDLKY
ncbi:hypothetical protein ACFX5D_13310 [Flavobacterium sp. LB3P45]|uniref:Uncharacterized protein n=1 Tax=Flavobacterium fructosi TaxID=3230416 RepID=A0ABW6HPG5_9FLAO